MPDPLGTIDYKVEDYLPSDSKPYGGEGSDYEAAYMDDDAECVYVGVISSRPWNPGDTVLRVSSLGVTIDAEDFDAFAWADLGADEVINYTSFANFYFEGKIAKGRFGEVEEATRVQLYANCGGCVPPDLIYLCDDTDGPPFDQPPPYISEPSTVILLCLSLGGLGFKGLRRRPQL